MNQFIFICIIFFVCSSLKLNSILHSFRLWLILAKDLSMASYGAGCHWPCGSAAGKLSRGVTFVSPPAAKLTIPTWDVAVFVIVPQTLQCTLPPLTVARWTVLCQMRLNVRPMQWSACVIDPPLITFLAGVCSSRVCNSHDSLTLNPFCMTVCDHVFWRFAYYLMYVH